MPRSVGSTAEIAADQIRAVARLRSQRLIFGRYYPGRRAPGVGLAPGYHRPPLQGFQFAASPAVGLVV